jgi:apolipoprotein N-acyltransferase
MTRRRRAPVRKPSSAGAGPAVPAGPPFERTLYSLLAAVAGALWFLSCADFDVWPLAWVASVPSLWTIERASTTRRAVLYGWVTGTVANAGGFYWITKLLTRFAHLPLVVALFAFLLMAAYQGVVFALFAWVYRKIRVQTRLPAALVAPLVMVAGELLVPMLFPWYLAITQAWQPHVIQVADLTGPLGVSALLLVVNGAAYELFAARRWRPAVVAAVLVAGALGYGELRLRQVDATVAAAAKVNIGLVQGNVPFSEKGYEHPELAAHQLDDLRDRSRTLDRAGADLIVWSETAFPYMLPRDLDHEPATAGLRADRGKSFFQAPLLFGAITYDVGAAGRPEERDPYNSAILADRDGRFVGRFDKTFLVMFSEQIPFVETFPWLRSVLPANSGNLTPGKEAKVFAFRARDGREVRIAPMICFEDIISAFSVRVGRKHPQVLVNITNDAWFGNTSEPWEHLALSVFRAVEVRAPLVRTVNTGVSAFVDPAGRIVKKSYAVDPLEEPRPADTLLDAVPVVEGGDTVYVAVGDVFGYLCAAATLFLWLALPRLRRRAAS